MARPLYGRESMTVRTFRVEDSFWDELGKLSNQEGYSRSQLIRIAVIQYLERNPVTTGEPMKMTFEDWMHHLDEAHNGVAAVEGTCSVCDRFVRLSRQ